MNKVCCGPGYASPIEAINAPREKLLYTIAIYTGTGIQKPDYLATVDVDPDSPTYSQVIHRLEMPGIGDELHHMGWNACSSCHDDSSMSRKYLILPGVRSNNLHIVDTVILTIFFYSLSHYHMLIVIAIMIIPTCMLTFKLITFLSY